MKPPASPPTPPATPRQTPQAGEIDRAGSLPHPPPAVASSGQRIDSQAIVGTFGPLPNWLMLRPEVSQGAKVAYARLLQYRGRNASAWPSVATLAKEIGVSRYQGKRYLKELRSLKLITSARTGKQGSNVYNFPAHPWNTSATRVTSAPSQGIKSDPSAGSRMLPSPGSETTPKKNNEEITEKPAGRRERWKIEGDRKSVADQLKRHRDAKATETATGVFYTKPEDREIAAKLKAKLKALDAELLDA